MIVDQQKGPYKTIQSAIDSAYSGTTIQVYNGIYFENLHIQTKNLKLIAADSQKEVIIMTNKFPTIKVNLKQNQNFYLEGLKLSHSGNKDEMQSFLFYSEKIINQEYNIIENKNQQKYKKIQHDYTNNTSLYKINNQINCTIYVKGGIVKMNKCFISLKQQQLIQSFIIKNNKNIIFGVVCDEETTMDIQECEIKGSNNKDSVGIFSKWANLTVNKTYIHSHQKGGLLIESHKLNKVQVTNSRIKNNTVVGINVAGQDTSPEISQNVIEQNQGIGILISVGNFADIKKNEIKYNEYGIKSISANPFIFYNKIFENKKDGINTCSYQNYKQYGLIQRNEIIGNQQNGIFCDGKYNFTKILNNTLIGLNEKTGIFIGLQSSVVINQNNISQNFEQGILLSDTSSAIIERNEISKNIKANIAFGGSSQGNTIIVENKIIGSINEGIYFSKGGNAYIARNHISLNNDGIVCYQASPIIMSNNINQNKSNGVILLNHSKPIINENTIQDNDGIGLFLRNKSQADMNQNKIMMNEINFAVENYYSGVNEIPDKNQIDGDIQIPPQNLCNIF